jgi:hypothetical protein
MKSIIVGRGKKCAKFCMQNFAPEKESEDKCCPVYKKGVW